jgi:glycosyltransferase involved in cell wall biosynthesis
MPKLLLITPFFPPSAASGSFRALGFAKHLPKFGWDLTVVASGPRPWEPNDPKLLEQIPAETQVHYVEFPLDKARQIHHQVMQRLKVKGCTDVWNAPTLKKCREVILAEQPDVIMTSGPPHNVHLIGRALQQQFSLPWVADFRDPWYSWGGEAPYINNNFLLEYYWERRVFRHADRIVANTANTAEMFKRVFPHSARRIEAVPNGYDPMPRSELPFRDKKNCSYVLLHTGEVYAGRNPAPIAEAMRKLGETNRLNGRKLVFRLLGRCDDSVQKNLDAYSQLIELVGPVPYTEALEEMRNADILVLLDSPERRIGVPAKLYEYICARRPVLAFARDDSDSAKILQQSGLSHAIITYWNNISSIQNAVIELISNRDVALNDATDTEWLTRETQTCRLSQMLEKLIAPASNDFELPAALSLDAQNS